MRFPFHCFRRHARHGGAHDGFRIDGLQRLGFGADDHIEAASKSIKNNAILKDYFAELSRECEHLVKTLESAQHLEEVSLRAENKIISKS